MCHFWRKKKISDRLYFSTHLIFVLIILHQNKNNKISSKWHTYFSCKFCKYLEGKNDLNCCWFISFYWIFIFYQLTSQWSFLKKCFPREFNTKLRNMVSRQHFLLGLKKKMMDRNNKILGFWIFKPNITCILDDDFLASITSQNNISKMSI